MSALGNCGTCYHWIPQRKDSGVFGLDGRVVELGAEVVGECHCHPPVPTAILTNKGVLVQTSFPMPNSGMWCSEYKANE